MKFQTEMPIWAQASAKRLFNRGRLHGLIICALDKDCNLVQYALGEGVDIIVDKIKNEITPSNPDQGSDIANPQAPTNEADTVTQ